MLPTLTIYTPTYNRSQLLPRVYESLCSQTCKDFLWLVVDDGSTDDTAAIVAQWASEGKLDLQYIHKENGGVHTARDLAYRICKTELITSVDSDDWLANNAVEKLLQCWESRQGQNLAGVFVATAFGDGTRACGAFPPLDAVTYQDFAYKYHVRGDKHTVLRTDVISALPDSPVYQGENLVGESYKWIQLPDDMPFLILDEPLYLIDYRDTGYSKSAALNRFRNPNGFRALYRQYIISAKYLRPRLKGHLGYIAFSLMLRERHIVRDSPKPVFTALLMPAGILIYLRFIAQRKAAKRDSAFK